MICWRERLARERSNWSFEFICVDERDARASGGFGKEVVIEVD
jgi:hypothetical protein